jgi:nucleoside-diphosphate-sugar epimerase
VPDISKINTLLGWRPTRTLEQILEDVIEWQRAPEAVVESA